jgi:hypothetical protein
MSELLSKYPHAHNYGKRDESGAVIVDRVAFSAYSGHPTAGGFVNRRIKGTKLFYRITTNDHLRLTKVSDDVRVELEKAIITIDDQANEPVVKVQAVAVDPDGGTPDALTNEYLLTLKKEEIIELAKKRFGAELTMKDTRVDLIDQALNLQSEHEELGKDDPQATQDDEGEADDTDED